MFDFLEALGIEVKNPQEIFTHLDNEGVARSFLCETMFNFAWSYPSDRIIRTFAPVDAKIASYMRTNHGIEQERVDRMSEPYLSRPLLAIGWDDAPTESHEVTIIDGAHRIVRLHEMGQTSARMFVFLYPFWENFMLPREVSDRLVAEGVLHRASGVIEAERKAVAK